MKSAFAKIFNFGSFENFALEEFHNGIAIKLADIAFGKYFIYLKSPQRALFPCVLYNSLLPTSQHRAKQKPILHFCACEFLDEILQDKSTKAKIMNENAFDYAVGNSAHLSAKLFYGVKLPFCAKCVGIYNEVFGAFDECDIWGKMFKNELFCAIEMDALRAESSAITKKSNYFKGEGWQS